MEVIIISKETTLKGNHTLFKVMLKEKPYRVLCLQGTTSPIMYDDDLHPYFDGRSWSLYKGYAHNSIGTMHGQVMMKSGVCPVEGETSIDHMNNIKTDNRRENLRYATPSQQISNRGTRCDKDLPHEELQKIGIQEYPRYVRWDKSENKFVIDKHPVLKQEVLQGIRKKAIISGSKSASKTLIEKYQDIIFRLKELDERDETLSEKIEFAKLKEQLCQEYYAIASAICPQFQQNLEKNTALPLGVDEKRATPVGRKSKSSLPEDCGVSIEMLPKYTYYRTASGNRGDKFVIDIRSLKYMWSTTGSAQVSTKDKFDELMNHIATGLPDNVKTHFA
jgi:hypothetical protein